MPLLWPSRTQLTLLPKGDMAASYSLIRRVSGHLKGERSHHARGTVFRLPLKRWRKAGPSPSPCHCTTTSWRGQPKVGTSLFSLTDARLLAQGLPGTHQTSWPPSGGLNWEENVRHRPLAQWKESRVHPNYRPTHCSGVQSELLPEESVSPVLWDELCPRARVCVCWAPTTQRPEEEEGSSIGIGALITTPSDSILVAGTWNMHHLLSFLPRNRILSASSQVETYRCTCSCFASVLTGAGMYEHLAQRLKAQARRPRTSGSSIFLHQNTWVLGPWTGPKDLARGLGVRHYMTFRIFYICALLPLAKKWPSPSVFGL